MTWSPSMTAGLSALVAWNASQPDWVRVFGCSDKPDSYETTLDYGKAVSNADPGALSDKTDAPTDPLGVFRHVARDQAGRDGPVLLPAVVRHWAGTRPSKNYRACPTADEALEKTKAHYDDALGRAVLLTPNPQVNRGVLWAKANMMRTMVKAQTGWCFVNDPTRSQQQRRARHGLVRLRRRLPEPGLRPRVAAGLCPQPGRQRQGRRVLRHPQRQDRRL